jgi:hypothetical protein
MVEQLLGLAKQWTLNEMGIRGLKYQLTKYLSYTNRKLDSGWKLLVNRHILMEVYPEMIVLDVATYVNVSSLLCCLAFIALTLGVLCCYRY